MVTQITYTENSSEIGNSAPKLRKQPFLCFTQCLWIYIFMYVKKPKISDGTALFLKEKMLYVWLVQYICKSWKNIMKHFDVHFKKKSFTYWKYHIDFIRLRYFKSPAQLEYSTMPEFLFIHFSRKQAQNWVFKFGHRINSIHSAQGTNSIHAGT